MEQIIANLLVADNLVIQKATAELQEAFKRPEAIQALCEIIVTSKEPQHRQYSAVLLSKRLGKLRNWQLVPVQQQQLIKQGMLDAIVKEPEKSVRNAIAQLIGNLVKHESGQADSWMLQVLKFVFDFCGSNDPQQSEIGTAIFATLTATAPDQFVPHIGSVCQMFSAALVATESSGNMATPVILNILQGMSNLVPFILGHNNAEETYQKAIPYVVKALSCFAVQDADNFIKAFDILENLADYAPKLLNGSLKVLIDFCLEVSNNFNIDDTVRVRACSYIGWLIRIKKKSILKQKLVEPILQVIFNLMATAPENEDDEDDEEYYAEDTSPKTTATQTMDQLAVYIPSERLIPPLLTLLDPALKGNNPLHKKAAYLCIAVIAEGCSDAICSKYLRILLDVVKIGITDPNPVVRNAAFFALGQFSEYLQPEVSKHAGEILPILFDFLGSICIDLRNGKGEPKHIDRMFYALETYCENLEDAIVPYLPALLERLFETLNPNNSTKLRELALSSVSSAASAAKVHMLPYFPQLVEGLNMYFVKSDNEDIKELRPQAIDTLATLARTIGKENFLPLTNNTMNFALTFLSEINNDEPELRTSLYNLFSALAEVVGPEMAPVLPKVVDSMLDSIKSSEEVATDFNGDVVGDAIEKVKRDRENNAEDIDIENSDDEEDDDDVIYSVENAYLDEKEQAIISLRLLAEHTGPAFVPYIQPCFEAIYKQLEHPQDCIRKVAIETLAQFADSLYKLNDLAGSQTMVGILIPKYADVLKNDEEFPVVLQVCEAFIFLLKSLKSHALPTQELKEAIFSCVADVLNNKVACQFSDGDDDENEEGEYYVALTELAGDVLPRLGEAMQPNEFAMYFGRILPVILEKLQKAKGNEEQQTDRSLAYGTMSESFMALQENTGTIFDTLLPFYLEGIVDEYEQARHNAVYGLGELVLHADAKSYGKYPQILQALSQAVAQEEHAGTLDNICGALARLIITNSKLVPLDQVLPVFIQKLPLREDFDENKSVFKCFQVLLTQGSETLLPVLDHIILFGLLVLHRNQYKDDETRDTIYGLLKELRARHTENFNRVVTNDAEAAAFAASCTW